MAYNPTTHRAVTLTDTHMIAFELGDQCGGGPTLKDHFNTVLESLVTGWKAGTVYYSPTSLPLYNFLLVKHGSEGVEITVLIDI